MLLDRECIGDVIEIIHADAFYRHEHQEIYNAVLGLYEANREIDIILVKDALVKAKKLEFIGGEDYLITLLEAVVTSANVAYYANIVKEKAMLRELIHAAGEILQDAFDQSGDVNEKMDVAEQRIFTVTQKKVIGQTVMINDLLSEAFETLEARKEHDYTGIRTGFLELDEMLSGLQRGEMIIIAGRPSMGKTSFALNVAEHIGIVEQDPVVIFSLEMSKQQLVERFLASRSQVDLQSIRRGILPDHFHKKLIDAGAELSNKPIFLDDTPGMTPLEIRAKCRRLKSQHNIQAVFIDYLQLMSVQGRVESRQQEVSLISRYLKALAKEMDVPVVVLSQLNRAAEGREGHRPRMSDLRESGSIEQDADVVMLLHREDYYHRGDAEYEDTNTAEVIIAKQRNGPTGIVELIFNGASTRFLNKSHAPVDPAQIEETYAADEPPF